MHALRGIAVAGATLGAFGLVGLGAGAAHAAVASGTVTITVSQAFLDKLDEADVALHPSGATSVVTNSDGSVSITFAATGGDASLTTYSGTISYSGSLTAYGDESNTSIQFTGLLFDLTDTQFDAQSATSGGELPLVDLAGTQSGNINGTTQTYSASDLQIDSAGATYLNSTLGTTVFTAGDSVGSFATTWTTS